jgi:hypothetical protein
MFVTNNGEAKITFNSLNLQPALFDKVNGKSVLKGRYESK